MRKKFHRKRTAPADAYARPFLEVMNEELRIIGALRTMRRSKLPRISNDSENDPGSARDRAREAQLTGIALSGGGIRSATFNLGVLQGLAELGILKRFDYLSTVSGGGYIGGWLTAWIKREKSIGGFGLEKVAEVLNPNWCEHSTGPILNRGRSVEPSPREPLEIHFLRQYSNYLTPKLGWFGADTWTMVAIYLRNLMLNLLMLVASLMSVILAVDLIGHVIRFYEQKKVVDRVIAIDIPWLEWIGVDGSIVYNLGVGARSLQFYSISMLVVFLLVVVSAIWTGLNHSYIIRTTEPLSRAPRWTHQGNVQILIVVPIYLAALIGSALFWMSGAQTTVPWWHWAVTGALLYVILGLVAGISSIIGFIALTGFRFALQPNGRWWDSVRRELCNTYFKKPGKFLRTFILGAVVAGAIGGVMVWGFMRIIGPLDSLQVAAWGAPLYVIALFVTIVMHIGVISRKMPDTMREWCSRLTAWLLIYSIAWIILFSFPVYGPPSLKWLYSGDAPVLYAVVAIWVLATAAGLIVGKRDNSSRQGKRNVVLEMVAKIGPYVFIIGLLAGISLAVHEMIFYDSRDALPGIQSKPLEKLPDLVVEHTRKVESLDIIWIAGYLAGGLLVAGFLSWKIDVNQFSMHLFYRNRLVRCYLGASSQKDRRPQPFTGFDPNDDILLCDLIPKDLAARSEDWPYDGPYPIINTALNLVGGDELAWQQRKATSFIFTPRFTGYLVSSRYIPRPVPFAAHRRLLTFLGRSVKPASASKSVALPGTAAPESAAAPEPAAVPQPTAALHRTPMIRLRKFLFLGNRSQQIASLSPSQPARKDKRFRYLLSRATVVQRRTTLLNRAGFRRTVDFAVNPDSQKPNSADVEPKRDETLTLGTALAISGAAASPNMGYHTSAPLAFLMTIFNIRLGWWIGNPRHERGFQGGGPRMLIAKLMTELFGMTHDENEHVYLSDGGHFENLGIYELIRRQCRFVVACDAGQDPDFEFGDLGNAIEKCRADLGVEIDIDVESIRNRNAQGHGKWHCAIGRIRYDRVDKGAPDGTLLYIKSSLTGDEPTDILRYASQNPEFPHQSTGDQWFSESQFESYRALGLHTVRTVIGAVGTRAELDKMNTERLFIELRQRWYPPSLAAQEAFSKHTENLEALFERIRNDDSLRFLDAQIFPGWQKLDKKASINPLRLPQETERIRDGFYCCAEMIQLMENVYLDLNLEQDYDHPDNRGWMNLFRHWAWSGMLRATWLLTAGTYGSRFQQFCDRRLQLKLGRIDVGKHIMLDSANAKQWEGTIREELKKNTLNFREAHIISQFIRRQGEKNGAGKVNEALPAVPDFEVVALVMTDKHIQLQIGIGFAIIGHEHRNGGRVPVLWYFRMQNHVRRMGLGRECMKVLITEYPKLAYDAYDYSRAFEVDEKVVPSDVDREVFSHLMKSAEYEV
jgi:predicted acylesterase/phospholipase RssA